MSDNKFKVHTQPPITWFNPSIYWSSDDSKFIHSSDFNPLNNTLALSVDDDIILYQIDERINTAPVFITIFENTQINHHCSKIAWSKDGNILAATSSNKLKLFAKSQIASETHDTETLGGSKETWKPLNEDISLDHEIVDIKWGQNKSLYILSDEEIAVYNFDGKNFYLEDSKNFADNENEDTATSMTIDPLSEFIAIQYVPASSTSFVDILDISTFNRICRIGDKSKSPFINAAAISMDYRAELAFTPDGKFLVCPRGVYEGEYCAHVFNREHFSRRITIPYASLFTYKYPPRIVQIMPQLIGSGYIIALGFGSRVAFFGENFEPITMISNISHNTPISTISFTDNCKIAFISASESTSGSICKFDFDENDKKKVQICEDKIKMKIQDTLQ